MSLLLIAGLTLLALFLTLILLLLIYVWLERWQTERQWRVEDEEGYDVAELEHDAEHYLRFGDRRNRK